MTHHDVFPTACGRAIQPPDGEPLPAHCADCGDELPPDAWEHGEDLCEPCEERWLADEAS